MIRKLVVQNYAIIEQLEMDFSSGLTIITGETGAGKSILLGALGLILGQRADSKVLYNADQKCIVEGHFDLQHYDLSELFAQHELDYDPKEAIIRREINPAGKSRAFINDTPANLNALRDITGALVDLHQQFDTLDLRNSALQLQMIDSLAGHTNELLLYKQSFKAYSAMQRELQQMVATQSSSARELDYLRFQYNELEDANLSLEEQQSLEIERDRLQNSEDIARKLAAAFNLLVDGDNPIVSQLRMLQQQMQSVSKYHAELPALSQKMDSLYYELEEIANDCERIAEQSEFNPTRFEEVQVRLDQLYKLLKKHGAIDVAALIALRNETAQRIEQLGDLSGDIARLEKKIEAQRQDLLALSALLSKGRKAASAPFITQVHQLLSQLGMEHAQLSVQMLPTELGPFGSDDVQFLFASNKGSRPMPIKDVASGGELSRLSLVTKSLVAASIPLPTLIFDEIDAGVSGDIALKMGQILENLAAKHQVTVITHSPQVAARGQMHYFVYKSIREDRTLTHVRTLQPDERIRSIAVMLSQNPPSDAALANAKELLAMK